MCGTKLDDDIEVSVSDADKSESAVNTFELHETTKNRTIRATFTNNVGTTFAETLAFFAGNRVSSQSSQLPNTQSNTFQHKIPLSAQNTHMQQYREEAEQQQSKYEEKADETLNDAEKIDKIFRFEDEKIILKESRLKAASKLDYGKRLVYLLIYASDLKGMNDVPREKINSVLKIAKVYDPHIRGWLASSPDLSNNEGLYELRNNGRIASKNILDEIFDKTKEDVWMPGKQSSKPTTAKKSKKDSSNEASGSGLRGKKSTKSTSKSGRISAKDMMLKLIDEKYFGTPRTVNEVITYCKEKKVQNYSPQLMSTTLSRYVKDHSDQLERHKNSDGQYEYFTS